MKVRIRLSRWVNRGIETLTPACQITFGFLWEVFAEITHFDMSGAWQGILELKSDTRQYTLNSLDWNCSIALDRLWSNTCSCICVFSAHWVPAMLCSILLPVLSTKRYFSICNQSYPPLTHHNSLPHEIIKYFRKWQASKLFLWCSLISHKTCRDMYDWPKRIYILTGLSVGIPSITIGSGW